MDAEQSGQGGAKKREIFATVKLNGDAVDFAKLRWSVLTSNPDNEKMLATLRDLLPKLAFHPALSPGARAIFDDARIVIPDRATLRRAVDLISPIHLLSEDADVKGDLFETLSRDLGQQKRSAPFRTPRHLIRVIVEMVNPEIGRAPSATPRAAQAASSSRPTNTSCSPTPRPNSSARSPRPAG